MTSPVEAEDEDAACACERCRPQYNEAAKTRQKDLFIFTLLFILISTARFVVGHKKTATKGGKSVKKNPEI
ncbi:MAG: hypothetical protein HQM04_14915 [Magnetococcales bacterium]|nr:hypothetical protein [Magnetococcales bacterium]MBF0116318.1 hypothetical protein [Magnetococcales bacterium]